jgi:hypothetical protein
MSPQSIPRVASITFILPFFAFGLYFFREFAHQGHALSLVLALASGTIAAGIAGSIVYSTLHRLDRFNQAAVTRQR